MGVRRAEGQGEPDRRPHAPQCCVLGHDCARCLQPLEPPVIYERDATGIHVILTQLQGTVTAANEEKA